MLKECLRSYWIVENEISYIQQSEDVLIRLLECNLSLYQTKWLL